MFGFQIPVFGSTASGAIWLYLVMRKLRQKPLRRSALVEFKPFCRREKPRREGGYCLLKDEPKSKRGYEGPNSAGYSLGIIAAVPRAEVDRRNVGPSADCHSLILP